MQTALDFGPQARRTDPATSHAAAAAVSRQMRERHHDVIVAALREHGPMGKDGISTRCLGRAGTITSIAHASSNITTPPTPKKRLPNLPHNER